MVKRKEPENYIGKAVDKSESLERILFQGEKRGTSKKGGISGGMMIKGKNKAIKDKETTDTL